MTLPPTPIKEYMVAHANNISELDRLVNKAISLGWQPYGNLIIHNGPNVVVTFGQVMVKY